MEITFFGMNDSIQINKNNVNKIDVGLLTSFQKIKLIKLKNLDKNHHLLTTKFSIQIEALSKQTPSCEKLRNVFITFIINLPH